MKCDKHLASKPSRPSGVSATCTSDEMAAIAKQATCSPWYASHMKTMSEVDKILTQKCQENYTPEQLHAWAHMVQMKNHMFM